jgi:hypothetical protein
MRSTHRLSGDIALACIGCTQQKGRAPDSCCVYVARCHIDTDRVCSYVAVSYIGGNVWKFYRDPSSEYKSCGLWWVVFRGPGGGGGVSMKHWAVHPRCIAKALIWYTSALGYESSCWITHKKHRTRLCHIIGNVCDFKRKLSSRFWPSCIAPITSGVPRNFSERVGVQQIKLMREGRENGDLGAVTP